MAVLRTLFPILIALVGPLSCGSRSIDAEPRPSVALAAGESQAVFAGGCFWCMERPFQRLDGVLRVVSGYTGGEETEPTYRQVASGGTGHVEAVQVVYDSSRISYEQLLDVFWRSIDPTDDGGQFADRGSQYRAGIFVAAAAEQAQAEASRAALSAAGVFTDPIVTPVRPAGTFYAAESYHQDYYLKEPLRYRRYQEGSGRKSFLAATWQGRPLAWLDEHTVQYRRPATETLREALTPMQYTVTQEDGTEPPFDNAYDDNKAAGIYVDVVSGEPLFASLHKYESGTGWPSFTQPLVPEHIVERHDDRIGLVRTEVRSRHGDSHLGHLFTDGPPPTRLRYCINSAALRFIPADSLSAAGYYEYATMFGAAVAQK